MADPLLGLGLPVLLLLAGTGLMLAEAVIPGAQFVVVGVAMFLSGLVGILLGDMFASIVALSVMTVVFGVFSYFAFREMDLYNGPDRGTTSDSGDLSGARAIVTERVTARGGSVRLTEGGGFDPNYRARSLDGEIPEGEEVFVADPGGGNVLTVQAMDAIKEDAIDRELARGRAEEDASTVGAESTGDDASTNAIEETTTADATSSSDDPPESSGAGGGEDAERADDDETETETERA